MYQSAFSIQEFRDTLGYIARIRPQAEKYGICCIVPPSTWTPSCPLREKDFWERVEFTTRVQQVDKLQNREPIKKRSKTRLQRRKRRRKRFRFGMNKRRNNNNTTNQNSNSSENKNEGNESDSEEKFGFQNGSDFTLEEFKDFSDEFKKRYFRLIDDVNCSHSDKNEVSCSDNDNNFNTNNIRKEGWSPSVEEMEGEYWRIVEEADEEIEVSRINFIYSFCIFEI
jgi:jmjN domain